MLLQPCPPEYSAFATEALARIRDRIMASSEAVAALDDVIDEAELDARVLSALRRALDETRPGGGRDLAGSERERALDALLATMLDVLCRDAARSSFALDATSFEQLSSRPWLCRVERIHAAIERADYDDAAVRALACVKLGVDLPSQVVADVLVGVERSEVLLVLARQVADDIEPLLDLVRRQRFAETLVGLEQTTYIAFALWQRGLPDVVRPVIVPRLRQLARTLWMPSRAAGVIGWLARQIGDPHLQTIYAKQHGEHGDALAETMSELVLDLWNMTIDEMIGLLPEQAPDYLLSGVPVRAAPKVGRNELCPCGSGKKFKRCCDGKKLAPVSAGPSRTERLRALEPRLEREQIIRLSRGDLAQLDLARLRDGAVLDLMRRQTQLRDWRRARLAHDELARRRGKDHAEDHLQDVIFEALTARRYDVARELLATLGDLESARHLSLEATLAARGPDALAQLEAAAGVAVRHDTGLEAIELAHAALRTSPALGILLARGALQPGEMLDAEVLLDKIEEARDELGLPPGDPVQDQFDALGGVSAKRAGAAVADAERERLTHTAVELRRNLDDASQRLAGLQRQVEDRERELARVERVERPGPDPNQRANRTAADDHERRALRAKIDELQVLIRERNEERADLRRQLAAATDSKADAPAAPTVPEAAARHRATDDPDEGVEALPLDTAGRGVLVPRFGTGAATAFEIVPRNVAALAMRTIGGLAAGDAAAWRAVKQAKDMPRQALMARIGIHHRLLFRTDDRALDVLDLVTRESLPMVLKRLRML